MQTAEPPLLNTGNPLRGALQNVAILAGLDDSALALLAERIIENNAPAQSVILREGDVGNRFFLIQGGAVRVCKNFGQPNEVELVRLGKGDFFGEMCILETLPRSATVQATEDATLYSLSSIVFYQLYESLPRQYGILLVNIARDLSRRLRHLDEVFAGRH